MGVAAYTWFRAGHIARGNVEGPQKMNEHGRFEEPEMNTPVSRDEFQLYDGLKTMACFIMMMSFILVAIGKMAGWATWKNTSAVTWHVARKTRCAFCVLFVLAICSISTVHSVASTMIKYHHINEEQNMSNIGKMYDDMLPEFEEEMRSAQKHHQKGGKGKGHHGKHGRGLQGDDDIN